MQQGDQQALVGQDNGRVNTVLVFITISPHEGHFVKGLFGLAHGRWNSDHTQRLSLIVNGFDRLGFKPLAVAIDEQRTRIMGRHIQQRLDAGIVPPEVCHLVTLEVVKQLHLGGREHTKSHKHQSAETVIERRSLSHLAQLHSRRHNALGF